MSLIAETEDARSEQLDNPESIHRACADMKLFSQEVLPIVLLWDRLPPLAELNPFCYSTAENGIPMYDVEAMVTETSPTVLELTADWPVDWLQEPGIRTMEIQRELLHGEILEPPSVPTERAEIDGNRANWPKLRVGSRVLVRCFYPGERTEH
jgi:hypothetical protein